ncbi:Thiol:disulfide interchange protein DsbD [Candidatus Methanoperedenaceae archaeon GB50]|nr:Thiol:disulfide interchange protein DsbD [Candidatus Methanoperedenaceae archaeon GB37]CAD7774334.1 Thiol:disulfide interchange protein DsbD [Candidatus Methanoperedenaceae archaeon GB50]
MRDGRVIGSVVMVFLVASLSIIAPGCVKEKASSETVGTWYTSYDEALNLSAESGKPVMIYFWADWCPVCTNYSHETLSDPVVVKTLGEDFVLLSIDLDNNEQKGVAGMYGVRYPPATVFVDSNGNVLMGWYGYVPPEMLIPILHNVSAMET